MWKEYEQVLCDCFNSMCGLHKRLDIVKEGENEMDSVGSVFAVGVLTKYPGSVHILAQKLSNDIENNWKIISQQLYPLDFVLTDRSSLNALVVHEIQVCEDEFFKLFPVSYDIHRSDEIVHSCWSNCNSRFRTSYLGC